MRPILLAAALAAVALAGCAGSASDDGSSPQPSASASMTSTGPPPKPVAYSDTLYLLGAPDIVLALPEGGSGFETGTAGNFGPGGGGGGEDDGPPSQWSYQATGFSNVTGAEIHVWVDIKEQLVQPPSFNPNGQTCTWYVRLAIGADGDPVTSCLAEPVGVIDPGERELVFDLLGLDVEVEANETISFLFGRTVFSTSQEDAVYVLSGTSKNDSRIVLSGLKEAIPE